MVTSAARGGAALALASALAGAGSGYAAGQEVERGWLGVRVDERLHCVWGADEGSKSPEWSDCTLLAHVRALQDEGPAAQAGLRVGDQLVALDGVAITLNNLTGLLGDLRASAEVRLEVVRDGRSHSIAVVPGPRPPDADELPMRATAPALGGQPALDGARVLVWRFGDAAERGGAMRGAAVAPEGGARLGMAVTMRPTEEGDYAIETSAVRVAGDRLQLRPARSRSGAEFAGALEEVLRARQMAYDGAASALARAGQVRARLAAREFRAGMARLAGAVLNEPERAVRFLRSFGGAEFEPVRDFSGRIGVDGLLVVRVAPGTVMARLGLLPGDLLARAGGMEIRTPEDLVAALGANGSEDVVVEWVREGRDLQGAWPGRRR